MIVLETHLGHGWVNQIPGQLSPATMALIEESSRGSRNRVGFEVEQVCCDGKKEVTKTWSVPHYSSVINRDVPAYALMAGVPARRIGWMSRHGERLDLPAQGEGEARCPATGERYRLTENSLESMP